MTEKPAPAISDEIIEAVDLAVERSLRGRLGRSMVMIGETEEQRGRAINAILGTVMDHRNYGMPLHGAVDNSLAEQLARVAVFVGKRIEGDNGPVDRLKRVVSGFRRAHLGDDVRLKDTEIGVADSGEMSMDLPDLLEELGKATKAVGKVVVIPVGEMQGFSKPDMTSLLMALHRVNQQSLPVILVGAGSPETPRLAGEARSYSERMLDFPQLPVTPKPGADGAAPDNRRTRRP
ncbi:MAG: hypothetical protein KI792_08955 [Alphaproteobacteria bacterium]|nr:hypothetical protein [Alphaproteobacteria bacterium SS10]